MLIHSCDTAGSARQTRLETAGSVKLGNSDAAASKRLELDSTATCLQVEKLQALRVSKHQDKMIRLQLWFSGLLFWKHMPGKEEGRCGVWRREKRKFCQLNITLLSGFD